MRAVQWLKVIRPSTEIPTEHHAPITPRICLDLARVDSVAYRLQPLVQRQFGPTQLGKVGASGNVPLLRVLPVASALTRPAVIIPFAGPR